MCQARGLADNEQARLTCDFLRRSASASALSAMIFSRRPLARRGAVVDIVRVAPARSAYIPRFRFLAASVAERKSSRAVAHKMAGLECTFKEGRYTFLCYAPCRISCRHILLEVSSVLDNR
jgi:hypothetical protein